LNVFISFSIKFYSSKGIAAIDLNEEKIKFSVTKKQNKIKSLNNFKAFIAFIL
jgi:hypothetical protein